MRPLIGIARTSPADDRVIWRGRKVLVTGATGFIGNHLCQALASRGAAVHAVARSAAPGSSLAGGVTHAGDLADVHIARAVFEASRPEVVYHLAGAVATAVDPELVQPTLRSNLLTTVSLLEAARETGCGRVVVAASADEPRPGEPPRTPYAASRVASSLYTRMYCEAFGVPAVLARIFLAYGPGQNRSRLVPYVLRCAFRGELPALRCPERRCDLVFVNDVVSALLALADCPVAAGAAVDVGSGEAVAVRDVAALAFRVVSGHGETGPSSGACSDDSGGDGVADTGRTAALTGWQPRWSLREGLEATFSWLRSVEET
ncbi:MAG: NAD(P)-dependent oxidoreductase [Acidobacteriota bacterium]